MAAFKDMTLETLLRVRRMLRRVRGRFSVGGLGQPDVDFQVDHDELPDTVSNFFGKAQKRGFGGVLLSTAAVSVYDSRLIYILERLTGQGLSLGYGSGLSAHP
jgi:hypothetical protein